MNNCKQTELKRNKGDSRDISLLSASSLHEGQSNMQMWRRRWEPCLPHILRSPLSIKEVSAFEGMGKMERSDVSSYFPLTSGNSLIKFEAISDGSSSWKKFPARRIGVVLSGGQASGGHNVIAGIMSYIKLCNQSSQLFGFLGGPEGVYTERYRELTEEDISGILNQGGFNVICSGRHKIESEEQMRASLDICEKLKLHGLVVIGGDDSNTNAAILAEYFKRNSSSTVVVGCPKTIDGDLKNEIIETSFGYDTAVKTYSEQIGSIMDAIKTERNRYYFVRLMGRSASHITLECGLQTRANMILIGEEIKEENRSLMSIVDEIVDMIVKRDSLGKRHGIVLLPEGLIEFIPEFETLIKELNSILLNTDDKKQIIDSLSKDMKNLFLELPTDVQSQLLLERDPHGNVQVAKIATEELLVHMARERLERIGKDYILNNVKTHYFGYEGRCALPSNFDASYCFALGHTAAALIDNQRSGYMAVVRKLNLSPEQWEPAGCPLTYMMNIELRKGKSVPVIKKYLVDLKGHSYLAFCQVRSEWKLNDYYRNPGPIQFDGPNSGITNYMISPPKVEELLRMEDKCEIKKRNKLSFSENSQTRLKCGIKAPKILVSKASKFNDDLISPSSCRDLEANFIAECLPHQTGKHNNRILQLREDENFSGYSEIRENCHSKCSTSNSLSFESIGLILSCLSTPGAQNVICGLLSGIPTLKQLIVFKSLSDFLQGKAFKVDLTSESSLNFFENSLNSGGCTFTNEVEVVINNSSDKKSSHTTLKINETQEYKNNSCIFPCKGIVSNDLLHQLLSLYNIKAFAILGGAEAATFGATLSEQLICMSMNGMKNEVPVVFIPVCLENSISHQMIEACVGFDSVTKSISTLVGNLLTDSASATKYWYFMKTIGAKTSNIALEVGIQTHPNLVVIPERYAAEKQSFYGFEIAGVTLDDIITEVCDIICLRSNQGKNFGGLIVSEGLFDQVYPTKEYRRLFSRFSGGDLSKISKSGLIENLCSESLSKYEKKIVEDFNLIFSEIDQKLIENLVSENEISNVQTEIVLSALVQKELKFRKSNNKIKNGMNPVCFSFTDQVRACFPSDFDSTLGLMYGMLASKIIKSNLVGGYIAGIKGVLNQTDCWNMYAIPISSLMTLDIEGIRGFKGSNCDFNHSLISKKFVETAQDKATYQQGYICKLNSVNSHSNPSFSLLMNHIEKWEVDNTYANPGPVQYFNAFKNLFNRTLFESQYIYTQNLKEIDQILLEIKASCQLGVEKDILNSTIHQLRSIQNSISIMCNCNHRKSKIEQVKCKQKKNSICDLITNLKYRNNNNNNETNLEIIVNNIVNQETCN